MREIVLMGLNHKTASVELRECIAFSKDEISSALELLRDSQVIDEIIFISTCNRVEVLMATEHIHDAIALVKDYIVRTKNVSENEIEKSLYIHHSDDAVRHIFRVASSLDSMVVGEPQILGQIKDAYLKAVSKKTSGVVLNRLLHRTFFVAKRIRTETGIGDHAVSISYAAIELGRKIFGSLEDKKVLMIGAGEMVELAVEHLIRNRVGDIYVANRTFEHGLELANRFRGRAVRFEEIPDMLELVDIIISSTGSPEFVVKYDQVKKIVRKRKNRPVFFIDIAVPRDIDPKINRITNSYVYDIDDLKGVIEDNIEDRNREAIKGERIVDESVIQFRHWYESLDVVPTIVALRQKMSEIAASEMRKTFNSLGHLTEADMQAIEAMTRSLINKILHNPTLCLKNNHFHGDKPVYLDITRKLFNLDN